MAQLNIMTAYAMRVAPVDPRYDINDNVEAAAPYANDNHLQAKLIIRWKFLRGHFDRMIWRKEKTDSHTIL